MGYKKIPIKNLTRLEWLELRKKASGAPMPLLLWEKIRIVPFFSSGKRRPEEEKSPMKETSTPTGEH